MASRAGGKELAQRAPAAEGENKKKKKASREEVTLHLPTRGNEKRTKTKSTSTAEQPDTRATRRPLTRQQKATADEGKPSSRVTARQRASIARHESRFLTVAAVNVASKRTDKEGQKSTANWRSQTASTHPTTAATAAAAKAVAVPAKKNRQPQISSKESAAERKKCPAPSVQTSTAEGGALVKSRATRATTVETGKGCGLCTRGAAAETCPTSTIPLPDVITVPYVRDPDTDIVDPQLCPEYIKDIYKYLMELERRARYAIDKNFLAIQKHVTANHRRILVDWLVQVHQKFVLVPETLYLTINIMDRVLQVEQIVREEFQLLGVTAMFIASKYEEIYPPSAEDMVYMTSNTYTSKQLLTKEREVLKMLHYELNGPSAIVFLRRFSKLMSTDKQVHNLAKYILEMSLMESRDSCIPSSEKAGAALLLAASLLYPHKSLRSLWCPTLTVYSGYRVENLQVSRLKLERSLYTGHSLEENDAIRMKYRHVDFMQVSQLKILESKTVKKS